MAKIKIRKKALKRDEIGLWLLHWVQWAKEHSRFCILLVVLMIATVAAIKLVQYRQQLVRETTNDMYKYVKTVKKIGVDYAQFNPFHYNQDDMRPIISKIQKENKDLLIISSHRYENMENRNNKKCQFGIQF